MLIRRTLAKPSMDYSALHFRCKPMQLDGHFGTSYAQRTTIRILQCDGAPLMFTIRHQKKIPTQFAITGIYPPTFSRKHPASTCQWSGRPWTSHSSPSSDFMDVLRTAPLISCRIIFIIGP